MSLPPKRQLARRASNWLAVALGNLFGLCGLLMFGQSWIPEDSIRPDWLALWSYVGGWALLGVVFLVSSYIALRNRRRAGFCFLLTAPLTALCLAYPEAFLYVQRADGGIYRESPRLWMVMALACLFFIPLFAPLAAIRNRKRAACLFLISAALAGLAFGTSGWAAVLLPRLAASSALILAFGAFWIGTDKLGWPPLRATTPGSLRKRVAALSLGCLLVAVLDLAGTFVLTAMRSDPWGPDCGERSLFIEPSDTRHAVFTARLIRVGHVARVSGKWAGGWAVGLVQEKFWGATSWTPGLILLTNHTFREGDTYFIDGRRDVRALSRFLPIVEAGPCTFTGPVVDATAELRLLREGRSARKVRIIGSVRNPVRNTRELKPPMAGAPLGILAAGPPETVTEAVLQQRAYNAILNQPVRHVPSVGARIRVTGSSGTTIVTTDRDGVYEVAGLPPDDYTLSLIDVPSTWLAFDRKVEKKELLEQRIVRMDFEVYWSGAIGGRVSDVAGRPAHVSLDLGNADGTITGDFAGVLESDKNGAFCFDRLPPRRYLLTINPNGPTEDSPYAALQYPSPVRLEDARALELAEGQKIERVDFTLKRLAKLSLRVHATWPNGQPAEEASIFAAYVSAGSFQILGTTDREGGATIPVFGESRIRVWAVRFIDDGRIAPAYRYSAAVEIRTGRLPQSLDLVLTSSVDPSR